ncbi:Tyrosine recombinase XerC [Pandoraea terrae]|uniref:Tyrosine recombinase XerC n=1 Tax=Pandoraea terrae TaxID=1537710 RepID=A0A5E4ZC52_9BURK|nr:tyrosine-type recombinase/integrase [Pandoraea terrae]VVE58257.1 Tyrosine recombinase XerC [Pandoraea terrae]
MSTPINSKTARDRLKPRREPYWARMRAGLFVGYRKAEQGEGTWIARRRDESGKQAYHALGTFADFDDAARQAEVWAGAIDSGVSPDSTTVRKACEHYVNHLRLHKSAASSNDAEGRFKRLVYGKDIGSLDLAKLRTSHLKAWVAAQLDIDEDEDDDEDLRRAKDSANRNLASFKAALNLALKDRLVATDAGWRTVVPFKGVGRRRQGFIPLEQRAVLMTKCEPDLARLVKVLLLTAARPGELAKATVQHFDKAQGTLALEGKTGFRVVTLSTAAARFFEELAKDKIGGAHLLVQASGNPWNKDAWKKQFKEAVEAAKLAKDIVMYSLRHTAISEMIAGGMDTFVVAKLAGTSTAMIDKHYGHLRHDRTRDLLDSVVLV